MNYLWQIYAGISNATQSSHFGKTADMEKNRALIAEMPETSASGRNVTFHNVFFESHLKEPNNVLSPSLYYGVLYRLQHDGYVDGHDKCSLLKSWVECYNDNLQITHRKNKLKCIPLSWKSCTISECE